MPVTSLAVQARAPASLEDPHQHVSVVTLNLLIPTPQTPTGAP